ncbi:hypothetical protein GPJ59_24705, partial [Streptomyces bambusae]|nr:hypothetical protein [Streptomyces bambusae]
VLVPLGRLSTARWRQALSAADGLRTTPWRGLVLTGARGGQGELARRLDEAGLVLAPGSAWESVTACTGRPGCAKSLADVRADATQAVAVAGAAPGPLPVHWSGCERRCGHPRGTDWVDVLATPDGYALSVHGLSVEGLSVDGLSVPGSPLPADPGLAAALAAARRTTPAGPPVAPTGSDGYTGSDGSAGPNAPTGHTGPAGPPAGSEADAAQK